MALVQAFRGARAFVRAVLAPVCATATVAFALRQESPGSLTIAGLFALVGTLTAVTRLHARAALRAGDSRIPRVDGGSAVMAVALAYFVVMCTGGLRASSLSALPAVTVAVAAALSAPAAGVLSAMLAIGAEAWAHLLQPPTDLRAFALRTLLITVAAAVHHGLTRLEIERVRTHAQKLLEDERARQKEAARSFRLIGAPNPSPRPSEQDEDKRVRASLDEIRQALLGLLDIVRRSLTLNTCALYWLDTRGQKLRMVEVSTVDVDALRTDPIAVGSGAVGGACAMGKAVVLSKLRPDYAGLTYYTAAHGVKCFAAMPIVDRGEVRGVLVADRADDRPFDDAEQSTLSLVASQSLRHVHNERVFGVLEKTKDELAKLFAASRALGEALTEDEVIGAVARSVRSVVDHDIAVLATYDPRQKEHRVRFVSGPATDRMMGMTFGHNNGIASAAVETKHALPYRGHYDARTQYVFTKEITLEGHQSVLCLPLVVRDHAVGTLTLAARRRGAFPDATRQLLGVLAGHTAVALSNAAAVRRLEELATTDPMTGLLNKRSLEAEFDRRLRSAVRFGKPLSVLVLDIDKFKLVNDTYGHSTGDVVIKGLGAILVKKRRETDAVARFGGEEFVVVCEETDLEGAWLLAERVREDLEQTSFPTEMGPLKVTCSIGIAEFPRDGETREHLFARADEALYEAKRGGRNQTRIAGKRQPPVISERRKKAANTEAAAQAARARTSTAR